ncbi:transcription initiation factor IIE subunit beta [Flammula alnicola]|nr:transcription initiation factor IIE subunit beta [Flammula alnicola]
MSKLARDAASFKSTLQRQDYSSWHSQPKPSTSASSSTAGGAGTGLAIAGESSHPPGHKKKRPKTSIVYSQPADTGSGTNINTQLVYAVNHLKGTPNPMRLQDLAIVTETALDTDPVLLEKFKAHDKIQYDPKTDLYSYKHEYTFRNKAALLTEIQRQTRKGGGISVRALKESWKEAPQAIEELEKEGEVLVTRTVKDGQLRMVFWNEIKPTEENGGLQVEKEFYDLWHSLKVPNDVDLLKQLASEGLQVTAAEAVVPKAPTTKKKGKRGGAPRQRQVRITNTHLKGEIDLQRDYANHTK